METYQSLQLQFRYRSGDKDALPKDFYNAVLPLTKTYCRAVGFFSSTCFLEISYGIIGLLKNNGKMLLITSPRLQDDDVKAIESGYAAKEIYLKAFMREMEIPQTITEKNRLNLLANLIENGILEIKIAVTDNPSRSMYHEKIGLFIDAYNNKIAISGSMNESRTAMTENFESFDVVCSWNSSDVERVRIRENDFNQMWRNEQNDLKIVDFPELPKEFIKRYKTHTVSEEDNDDYFFENETFAIENNTMVLNIPKRPKEFEKLYDYQEDAITVWVENGYRGIFDMATGTGKTLTGLGAITRCSNDLQNKLAVIIVAPYQHLVEQWVEDIEKFNIHPIVGYSASSQRDWKTRLQKQIQNQNILLGDKNNFICFLCTNATFATDYVQEQISLIKSQKLLVVDEAHNFGTKYLSKKLFDFYNYRLALSATIDRYGDEEGTKALFDFFGEKCIEYDIERAIKEKKLTEYRYFPIFVTLTDAERIKYKQLSSEIKKYVRFDKNGKPSLSLQGKILAMQRAHLIAGMSAKLPALEREIEKYKTNSHILVYCGSTQQQREDSDSSDFDDEGERQIVSVSKMLGNELGMKCHHFTANENIIERKEITRQFSEGDLQCIVAIKCLDEGVNIPKIKTAFILASTTNPKEYIQRRGRVLRLAKGKTMAEIYDFIAIPYSLDEIHSFTENELQIFSTLLKNELKRGYEFTRTAKYGSIAERELDKIKEAYDVKIDSVTKEDRIYELR